MLLKRAERSQNYKMKLQLDMGKKRVPNHVKGNNTNETVHLYDKQISIDEGPSSKVAN